MNKFLRICKISSITLSFFWLSFTVFTSTRDAPDKYLPTIYVITPTYPRPQQIPEILRLSYTLAGVKNIHWLVVEDSFSINDHLMNLLQQSKIPFSYLLSPMPEEYRNQMGAKPKGVSNRSKALEWIKEFATTGVFYFADDDNTYHRSLFEEMRWTKRVSMWPVGLVTHTLLSAPVLKEGVFVDWFDGWIGGRKFPVDMAGFAVNVEYFLKQKDVKMVYKAGYEEDSFLRTLNITPHEIEFKADNCSQILVWHTKTIKYNPPKQKDFPAKYQNTNLLFLQKEVGL